MTLAGKIAMTGLVIMGAGVVVLWGCVLADADVEGPAAWTAGSLFAAGLAALPVAALVDIWGTP